MAPIGANFAVERLGDRSQEVAVTALERDQENETDTADELVYFAIGFVDGETLA